MFHSLRARLLFAVGIVVVLAIATVGILTRVGTRAEIAQFLEVETVLRGT